MKKIISIKAVSLTDKKSTFFHMVKDNHKEPMTDEQIEEAQREYNKELSDIGYFAKLRVVNA
jgi:hypothetical protein